MNQDSIRNIKGRASTMQKILKFIFFIGVILSFAILIGSVVMFFASPERFNAVKGNMDWSINYKLNNGPFFFINVPYKIIDHLNSMWSAKYAAMTSLFSMFISICLPLYGIKQVLNILKSTANDISPFIMDNVRSLKRLAYTIIIYSAALDLLRSLLCSIFVTKIYPIDLSNIHLSGVLIGGLIFVIADIFKYGVFLQKEFDTTL